MYSVVSRNTRQGTVQRTVYADTFSMVVQFLKANNNSTVC